MAKKDLKVEPDGNFLTTVCQRSNQKGQMKDISVGNLATNFSMNFYITERGGRY